MQKSFETTTITVPVPLHDPVRRGTLRSIVRQSELPRSLFETESQADVLEDQAAVWGQTVNLNGDHYGVR